MQLNKERQRRIRQDLHKSLPSEGTPELEIWHRNQQQSPLLRLPPELRNRIYDLVLRVGQINVCYKKWEHKKRFRKGVPYYETREGGFWCRILRREQNPWPGNAFRVEPPHGLTLLSPVCRQLYHETALLPYTVNTWSFESRYVMDRYVVKEKRLPLSHRRAIKILYSQGVLTAALEKYFGGLEVVLLEGGVKMTKHIIDADPEHAGRRMITWDISNTWWK
ncbi:hypothetical protein QBC43DRAFT_114109 [Cladorrhinum sp. PSN259]|nr:hypothetical protein QBC43DRAFT_114109 [Cladorrhinum sp. PSN259]